MEKGLGLYQDYDATNKPHINTGCIVLNDTSKEGIIPEIEKVLRREMCDILVNNGGGVVRNAKIPKHILRDIEFPPVNGVSGSLVTFFTEPYSSQAYIMGIHNKNDETSLSEEATYKVLKTKGDSIAVFSVCGDGSINIECIGGTNTGGLDINVRNENYTANVNLNVKGNININCEGDTIINNSDGDITLNTNQNVNINPNSLIIGGGDEPMLLGTTTSDELTKEKQAITDILNSFSNLVAVNVVSGSPDATWEVLKASLKLIIDRGDYSSIKSTQSFLK